MTSQILGIWVFEARDYVWISVHDTSQILWRTTFPNRNPGLQDIASVRDSIYESYQAVPLAVVFSERKTYERLAERCWRELDLVSFLAEKREDVEEVLQKSFTAKGEPKIRTRNQEILPHPYLVSLKAYEQWDPESVMVMKKLVKDYEPRELVFISSTKEGGGVALMRHALSRYFRLFGVSMRWYQVNGDASIFSITKHKFHNILQNTAPTSAVLKDSEKRRYRSWIADESTKILPKLGSASVVIIDDPQPSGLIPYIKKAYPGLPILYRSHIQIRSEDAHPNFKNTWAFLWQFIDQADYVVAQPFANSFPEAFERERIVFHPATTDPFDGLNKQLTKSQREFYRGYCDRLLKEQGQAPIDWDKQKIIQLARFDPAKGYADLVSAYQRLCERYEARDEEPPQLILAGMGAHDDPQRDEMLKAIRQQIRKTATKTGDIKILRLPFRDQLMNLLLREADVVCQLSHSEGFEIKVTEAQMKGKPVITYAVGGLGLQVHSENTGYLLEKGDVDSVVDSLEILFKDVRTYRRFSKNAANLRNQEYFTPANALFWYLFTLRLTDW